MIAHSFQASSSTYEKSATIQKEISRHLINLLKNCDNIDYSRVLEIGCCTGVLTELLCTTGEINTLFVNDIVPGFCSSTAERVVKRVGHVQLLPGDIEELDLPRNLDLVISSSTFQWMNNLEDLFNKIHGSLTNKGYLVFSIFGSGTMQEISTLTGQGLQYHTRDELYEMLGERFTLITSDNQRKCLYFNSVRGVLRHIRETGVGGLGRRKLNREKLRVFEKEYRERFLTKTGLPTTYDSNFIVARKKT